MRHVALSLQPILMKRILVALNLFSVIAASAQSIVSGPVVGGVTSNSARIYLRTNVPTEIEIELDTTQSFSTSILHADSTHADNFNVMIADVENLVSSKEYFYRFTVNGNQLSETYRFNSFPEEGEPGHYKVVVGSCNYFQNFPLFQHIQDFDPMLFIHLGDWNYPPSTFGWDYNLHPDLIAESFSYRFNDVNMKQFIEPNCAIDYVYDDSYCHNGNQGATHPQTQIIQLGPDSFHYDLQTVYFDEGVIPGAINGYFDHFPGYEAVDTAIGIHHSFNLGNVEFFMLDLRNSATPQNDPFIYDESTNSYEFEPGPDHSLMSAGQRDWLLDGLSNSTADWKIIGSSVMFNKRFGFFREVVMTFHEFDPSLITYASDLAYLWHAYPADQNEVLDHIEQNGLKDVIVISGDSHSSMVDDGTNAGLPELSASGLTSEDEGYLNYQLDSIISLIGLSYLTEDSLWNGGGNGVGNSNFSDSYGTMEFFGRDSLRLCAMDEMGQEMGCLTIYHSSNPMGLGSRFNLPKENMFLAYPNPTKESVQIRFRSEYRPSTHAKLKVSTIDGRSVHEQSCAGDISQCEIDLSQFNPGIYNVELTDGEIHETRKVVVH